ncbi:MAG: fructosamine kinase family protein [Chloroflexi bacterium]|nr:fructosamine kinase family protein [Chloroflexota bacterium]
MDGGDFRVRVENAMQQPVRSWHALAGGMISQVLRVKLTNGDSIVAKVGDGGHDLTIEAYMLRYLREYTDLPAPAVLHAEPNLLLMEYVPGQIAWEGEALRHLGELLAGCHQVSSPTYGLERDTLNGPLRQPNPQMESWIAFFREQRLGYMIGVARDSGRLPAALELRLRRIADEVERFLIEPSARALIHGDMWRTNVIMRAGRVAGVLDPALYYAHNEMELAYMTLFSGTGEEFFDAYASHISIDKDFYSTRRHIYNLYPLLAHLTLFGEKYVQPIQASLQRFGF